MAGTALVNSEHCGQQPLQLDPFYATSAAAAAVDVAVPASAVDPERGGTPFDGRQATRPHFTSSMALAMAASEAKGRLQIGH